ncbi:MAG TPA: 16S rRNA (guanine(966)-N(2))-methyltransferase RsmD, partial [Tabrizicola sp.]|nr:16S rRNA (guanine(966)-N(2))-methyltransferase RsmD [Tabrizicola sp.]
IAGGWLSPGTVVVWEESAAPQPPAGLVQVDQRKYGDTVVTLLKAAA